MSVLIKGMKKPRNCGVCPFNKSDMQCDLNGGWIDRDDYICETKCPIVEVPTPHGRLVDADEITKNMNTFQDSFVINVSDGRFGEISCTAKTIVESEE